jgi:hypothetical protein
MDLLRRRLVRAALFVAVPLAGGCLWMGGSSGEPARLAFPHARHGEDDGLECASCHRNALTADPAGMPSIQQCRLCHKEIDRDKPPEKQAAAFFENDVLKGPSLTKLPSEIVFSHLLHASTEHIECAECHGDVAKSDAVTADVHVSMAKCTACHARNAERGAAWGKDCAVCHKEIRADRAPPSHATDWKREHGRTVQRLGGPEAASCTLCHARSACTTCHRTEQPDDHTNYWRRRGHGVAVAVDRDRCTTCHQADACERCHSQTAPLSHSAGWGSPSDRHCITCHFPLGGGTGCIVCHRGAPSHALAAPMPPDHTPAMNCRQCHGHGAPLPHPDKGDQCTACHK